MNKPTYPKQPKKPVPPKEIEKPFIRKEIKLKWDDSDSENDSNLEKNLNIPSSCSYFNLSEFLNTLPLNIDYKNVYIVLDNVDYSENWIADLTYFIPQDFNDEVKNQYLKELEEYHQKLLKYKEEVKQWELDKIKWLKDQAEYQIIKNKEKMEQLKNEKI